MGSVSVDDIIAIVHVNYIASYVASHTVNIGINTCCMTETIIFSVTVYNLLPLVKSSL